MKGMNEPAVDQTKIKIYNKNIESLSQSKYGTVLNSMALFLYADP